MNATVYGYVDYIRAHGYHKIRNVPIENLRTNQIIAIYHRIRESEEKKLQQQKIVDKEPQQITMVEAFPSIFERIKNGKNCR